MTDLQKENERLRRIIKRQNGLMLAGTDHFDDGMESIHHAMLCFFLVDRSDLAGLCGNILSKDWPNAPLTNEEAVCFEQPDGYDFVEWK